MIVIAHEDHVPDAALAEREQHRGELGSERRIDDERQRREQQAQPLELLRARLAAEGGVDDGELDGPRADAGEHFAPRRGARERETYPGRATQPLQLHLRDRG